MMAILMGVRSAAGVARACELGVAMQLSNIARDVGEDARMGRIYLPLQWLREAGLDTQQWLAKPEFNSSVATVVQRLLDAAEELYTRIDAGVAELPLSCRPGINAARFLYAEIGREVSRRGLDSVSQRAVVAPARKAWWLANALVRVWPSRSGAVVAPLPAIAFLVEAVVPCESSQGAHGTSQVVQDRTAWVIQLFEKLERQDRAVFARSGALTRAR